MPGAVKGKYTYDNYTFAQISCGTFHTCAVLTDGTGLCWGECRQRQGLL